MGEKICAIRDPVLYSILKEHTAFEDETLRGIERDHRGVFASASQDCIDYHKMPGGDKLVNVMRNPRFEHIPQHKHNFIEACYVCSGHITHIIGGKQIRLEAGDFLMLNQYTSHELLPAGEDDVAVNFVIQARFFEDAYELAAKRNVLSDFIVDLLRQEVNCNQYLHYKTLYHLPVSNLLEVMLANFFPHNDGNMTNNNNSEDEGINKALMFLVFRYLSKDLSSLSVDAPMNYDQVMMATVMNYIDSNYQVGTLNELADIMNQSPSVLCRQIKTVSGRTFKELLQARRFERAVKLLEETNLTGSDIALAVGYENSSYFYRRFRAIYGVSPKTYRMKAQSGEALELPVTGMPSAQDDVLL